MATHIPSRDTANLSYAALVGASVTVFFLLIIIITADLQPSLKDWLKATFTHHWVGKSVLADVVFFASGAVAAGGHPKSETDIAEAGQVLYGSTIVASIILILFFLYQTFVKG